MNRKPELLSPAGSLEKMRIAFDFGADAVYAGQPRYSLRARNNDFGEEEIHTAIQTAHERKKKFFLALNLYAHNAKLKTFERDIAPLLDAGPDALIMADPGLIQLVREKWPSLPVHLSVQANTVNYRAVNFWKSAGVSRVILSRELSLDEIKEIRDNCPEMEIEVFVHGALCIAYSGRCLLSGYFNHRDANQGVCTNACRWEYKVRPAQENFAGDFELRHGEADGAFLLEDTSRPGQLNPMFEDEHGTYIMNSKDLRAVEQVRKLVEIGVDSLKIEGRTKSPYYVARTAQVYRQAIDDAAAGRQFDPGLMTALDQLANRGYTPGFFERKPAEDLQNYEVGVSTFHNSRYVGDIVEYNSSSHRARVVVKNRFEPGDRIEILHPGGNRIVIISEIRSVEGAPLEEAPGSGWIVDIPCDFDATGAMITALDRVNGNVI